AARGQCTRRADPAVPAGAQFARGLRDGHRRQGLPARRQPPVPGRARPLRGRVRLRALRGRPRQPHRRAHPHRSAAVLRRAPRPVRRGRPGLVVATNYSVRQPRSREQNSRRIDMLKAFIATAAAALALAVVPAHAQNITAPAPAIPEGITVESPKVPGPSLEGNLEGNATVREAMVVLPPSYKTNPNKRYPVVYYLHGFAIDGRNFYNYMKVPEAVAKNAAQGNEFIVVVPDTLTKMGGSMYSSSVTTGDFRKFVAKDLVAYIDANYRTIATPEGRGLAGHSMGGYGTWVVGMTYPEVFDSIWAQSACCVSPRTET